MILGLVFSKDRALQLDACLTSFARQVTDADSVRMVIVFAASSPRFLRQYQELAIEHRAIAEFLPEGEFHLQLRQTLHEASPVGITIGRQSLFRRLLQRSPAPQDRPADCVLFLVDDALVVGPFALATAQGALHANPAALGFSLRLGRNTTQSYVLNRAQQLPLFQRAGLSVLRFDWTKADGDFGYPLEVSSSMYRMSTMNGLLGRLKFADPNTLESQLAINAKRFTRSHPLLLCWERSVAFSAPLNRVQAVYTNRSGENPEWSAERLADRFDEGHRLDVAALDGFVPAACHQEVELSLVKRQDAHAGG